MRDDVASADLDERAVAMVVYATKLTKSPAAMKKSDLDAMRHAGLTDRDILDVNLTVAYYAYVNRIADGLGVRLESED